MKRNTETFEIRINDGFGSFSSIFKIMTYDEAVMDLYKLFNQMEKMGVQVGTIEVRNERNEPLFIECFKAAADRVKKARQARKHKAMVARWEAAGFNAHDIMR